MPLSDAHGQTGKRIYNNCGIRCWSQVTRVNDPDLNYLRTDKKQNGFKNYKMYVFSIHFLIEL